MSTTAYGRILDVLENVKHSGGDKARALCPAHDSASKSSLSVKRSESKVLVHCFAGCTIEAILDALGWSKADLYDDRHGYVYTYPDGVNAHRAFNGDGNKKFWQSGNLSGDSTKLYRLERVEAAKLAGHTIWLVEGEDDVHALETLGVTATTTRGGVGMMGKADLTPLYGAHVNVVVDKDQAGAKRARYMHTMLEGKAKTLAFVQAKEGKDAADHIAADHRLDDFVPYLLEQDERPRQIPPTDARTLKVTRASDIEMRATQWLWEDEYGCWIPMGSLVLLGGRESVGKSTLCAHLTAQVTRGNFRETSMALLGA